ncbi:MAG: DEAD/DEAH box helicase [Bacteroidetes bacterium]|nr:DEAD/DEAH box helicase [Bacteroidota bacterium]MDA0904640.1 DEAD/DEAH box helicase [Bacteroidota bacterium]MDA1243329.1 DEAD/DEAH box helicase [Bacteroidota bacterium]
MHSFDDLGLSAPILRAIQELGFETPTDIQHQAIPLLLEGGRDFIGLAQTGTGKTAAFGLPLLEHLDPSQGHVQALVLAPTRELGQQIAEQIELYSKHKKGVKALAVYGGANISMQIRALKSPTHVVIATPGRLIDLIKRKAVVLDQIGCLVLDEADEMLNMGFKEELDTILDFTPKEKHTWLFSATMPTEIRRIVKKYMVDPLEVQVNATSTVNSNIEHRYALVRHSDKTEAIARFLDMDPELYGVVFCRTRRDTQELAEALMKRGYSADCLHGEMSQVQRDRVMKRFKDKNLQMLVATDVAARGIDVDDLTHVFHHSLPGESAQYAHRSGRTARAGKKGISMALMSGTEKAHLNRLANTLDIDFTQTMVPNHDQIVESRLLNWAQGLLSMEGRDNLPPELWEQVSLLFGDHSQEEVLRLMLMREMQRFGTGSKLDLNQSSPGKGSEMSYLEKRRQGRPFGRAGKSSPADKPRYAGKTSSTGKSQPFSRKGSVEKATGSSEGSSGWDGERRGKPMGAGKAKKKVKKTVFKPGKDAPWQAKTTGRPSFGVKKKKR